MSVEHILFTEKYRPKTIADCILPDELKNTFQEIVNKKEIPNLLLYGTAGVGKTTVAKALCDEIGCDFMVINASTERGIDTIRNKISNYASTVSFLGGRKVIIVDEADYLTPDAQAGFRGVIEEMASNCSFIFTCNNKSRLMDAIQSRCAGIDFKLTGSKVKMASAFFKRVEFILKSENIEYDKEVVAAVITKHFPDNRRILNELQRYSVSGVIDKGILANVADVQLNDVIKALKNKDFGSVRKWIANNTLDARSMYRKLYDSLYDLLEPSSIPQLVLHLAKYDYNAAFVMDQELNLTSCLIEIMCDCSFRG